MNPHNLDVPVLLVAFNRPNTTRLVFQKIREAKPLKFYIAVDGARTNIKNEITLVEEVKSIVEEVDWVCETHYKYNVINKGAEITVSSAISWVFEKEEFVIILEDDILAPLSFFHFAEDMLKKYTNETTIATITGSNFTPIPNPCNTDYFFAKYGHSWGWATWRRAWNDFNLNVDIPKEHLNIKFLKTLCNSSKEARYYQKMFNEMKKRGPGQSTWDIVGLYYHRINKRLSIIPCVNLTSNIGIYGFHANGKTTDHFRPTDDMFVARRHPKTIECFVNYDIHHFTAYINKKSPLHKRLINKINRLFSQLKNMQYV